MPLYTHRPRYVCLPGTMINTYPAYIRHHGNRFPYMEIFILFNCMHGVGPVPVFPEYVPPS